MCTECDHSSEALRQCQWALLQALINDTVTGTYCDCVLDAVVVMVSAASHHA